MSAPPISRRRLLGAGAAALVVTTGDRPAAGAPWPSGAPIPSPPGPTPLRAADFAGLGVGRLLPEQMAGPFPLAEQFDRRDITEGVPGRPMHLGLRVVDAAGAPVPGAAVEVWHCDATGDYSAFADGGGGKDEAEGTTFLRGTQTAGDDGIVEFLSIVPGWYPGRAVHVHLRVHVDGAVVLTSQLYFDAEHLAEVYQEAPYAEFGPPDTANEDDAIAGDPARDGTLLHTAAAETSAGPGTRALANLGVDVSRTSS